MNEYYLKPKFGELINDIIIVKYINFIFYLNLYN